MPATLKVDPQRRTVLSVFHGRVTGKDVVRHQDVIAADPHFQPSFADIVDFSAVSITDVDDKALSTLAGTRSIFDDGVPHIIVAPANLPYEAATKYREFARQSRPNLHVVRTLREAQELLDGLGYRLMSK
jgi:hypothetical protein